VTLTGSKIAVKGKLGTLERELHPAVAVKQEDGQILVQRQSEDRRDRALHGLTRALIHNMVKGVSEGFRKTLEIVGVGYKVELKDKALLFSLGYSHPILLQPPPGVTFEVEKPTLFHVIGADKELVGQVAAKARSLRKPDPYKGKGVRYGGEVIRLKAGKTSK
jgi:large subunit ribosomal protein L6